MSSDFHRRSGEGFEKYGRLSAIFFIFIFSCLIYSNSLFNNFVLYDDRSLILENPWIRDIRHIPDIFLKSAWAFKEDADMISSAYFRPLVHLINMASYHIFGLAAWGFHFVGVFFHAANSVLVFLITARLVGTEGGDTPPLRGSRFTLHDSRFVAFMAALLFAAHPIHTEAVAWAAALSEISFSFFYLLSLYFYMRFRDGLKPAYFLSVLSFFLAALCKETSITLPLLLLSYDYFFRKDKFFFTEVIKRYLPFSLAGGIYLLMRFKAFGSLVMSQQQPLDLNTYQYLLNVLPLFMDYLKKLLFPLDLNAYHSFHPVLKAFDLRFMTACVVTALFIACAFISKVKNRLVFFGLIFMVIPLLPAFYIPALSENVFAERYLYLPSFGFALLSAWAAAWTRAHLQKTLPLTVFLALLTGLYCLGTVPRNAVWKDDYTLFADTVKKSPDKAVPHNNLGVALYRRGHLDAAIEQYLTAIRLDPFNIGRYVNVGNAYMDKGMFDEAIQYFKMALYAHPTPQIYTAIADSYVQKGLIDEGIQHFESAIALQPGYAAAYDGLGLAYMQKGSVDAAKRQFETAVSLEPYNQEFQHHLSEAYRR